MALSGSALSATLLTAYQAQLTAQFPIPTGLLAGEQSALLSAQQKLAMAFATGGGPAIVTQVQTATVTTSGVTAGSASAVGVVT